jgi:endonuclease-3
MGSLRRTRRLADVRQVIERLEEVYGRPEYHPRMSPMDELVSCILSQHTTDATSFPAFDRLRQTYKDWPSVIRAGPARVAEVIRSAGLANQKARNIVACLREIRRRTGGFSLDHLAQLPVNQARKWLEDLPGVGPKTASIVLAFAFGMPVVPVDTHVFRVAWRVGWIDRKLGAAKAHDELLEIVPPDLTYRFHMALIRHGREVCRAPKPKCEACVVAQSCRHYSESMKRRKAGAKAKSIHG